jgi:glycosyltransferase involved in cell wall biosynthesis
MIAFDLRPVQSRAHGERGIARFTLDLGLAIERADPGRIGCFLVDPDRALPDRLLPFLPTGRVYRADDPELPPVSLLHLTSPVELDIPIERLIVGQPRRIVANLYDLIPLIFPDRYLTDRDLSARYRARLGIYPAADWVLGDSQSAVDDAVRLLGVPAERATPIWGGTSTVFRPPTDGRAGAVGRAQQALPDLRPGYLMLPSGIDWRKNIETALRAFAGLAPELRAAHHLVLVCAVRTEERAALTELAASLGCADSFLITGFVSDELLVTLYQGSHLVVYPSRYEGFGFPVLEAARCGAAVVAGDNSSLREVQPNPEARFDADDVDGLRDLLTTLLRDERALQSLRDAPVPDFTWEGAAARTLAVYDRLEAADRATMVRPPRRPSIAMVCPFPPVPSGIADYSYRLVGELLRTVDVHCFTDQDLRLCRVPQGAKVSPIPDLHPRALAGEFDRVLYVLGNNPFHAGAVRALRRTPGIVHLHDVRLSGCYADEHWPDLFARHYPERFDETELTRLDRLPPLAFEKHPLLLGDVARHATAILTNSEHAAQLVRLDTGRKAVVVGPLAVAPRVVADGPRDLVASFGIVSATKQCDKVLEAFTVLRDRHPELTFAFVGEAPDGFGAEGITVTGFVDEARFSELLDRTVLAVQLRETTNGESSAAVADCIAGGTPVVVSDFGAQAELPDDVVVKVPREITAGDLADVVETLFADEERRESMSAAGRRYADRNDLRAAAARLLGALGLPVAASTDHDGSP